MKPPETPQKKFRILHIDADEGYLLSTKESLEKMDKRFEVDSVSSFHGALERLTGSYDCIISDYTMPGFEGFEYFAFLRDATRAPVVVYTGRGSEDVIAEVFSLGANGYVRKEDPSHIKKLTRRVREAIEKKRAEELYSKILDESREELRRERDRAQKYLNVANVIIVALDMEGNVTLLNRKGCEALGYTAMRALGKNWFETFIPEVNRSKIKAYQHQRLTRDALVPFDYIEYPVLTRSGSDRLVAWSNTILRDEEGRVKGMLSSGVDITEARDTENKFRALHSHAVEIGRAHGLDEIARLTMDTIEGVLGFKRGGFGVLKDGYLSFVALKGMQGEVEDLPIIGPGVSVRAVRKKRTQRVDDTRLDRDSIPDSNDSLSALAVPLMSGEECFGVIHLEASKPYAFTRHDEMLVETLAMHVSSAYDRIRSHEDEKRYKDMLEALHRHATELASASTIEEVAEATIRAIRGVTDFHLAGFGLVEDDVIYLVRGMGIKNTTSLFLDGPGVVVRAVRTGEVQLVPDTRLDEDYISEDPERDSLSELCVPIKMGDEVVGTINVESPELNAFTENDKKIVEILARHVSSALHRLQESGRLAQIGSILSSL